MLHLDATLRPELARSVLKDLGAYDIDAAASRRTPADLIEADMVREGPPAVSRAQSVGRAGPAFKSPEPPVGPDWRWRIAAAVLLIVLIAQGTRGAGRIPASVTMLLLHHEIIDLERAINGADGLAMGTVAPLLGRA